MAFGLPPLSASLGISNETRATSGLTGAVISGGQNSGPPWYVWLGLGVIALVVLLKG